MTVFWNVENPEVSHVDPSEVNRFMEWLEGIYRELRITRGKVHKYLGMRLDFQTPKEIQVTMLDCLKGVLEDFSEVITGISTSLSDNHIFQVRPEYERTLLDKERSPVFHHTVAQLIFVTPMARKYINVSIAFPCTRVRSPFKGDWGNLLRVLRYIRGTLHMLLILSTESLSVIKWWVDFSFAAHPYWKGHTGVMVYMGSGSIMKLSWKQKKGENQWKTRYWEHTMPFHSSCGRDTLLRDRGMLWIILSSTRITWVLCSWKIMGKSQARSVQSTSECDTYLSTILLRKVTYHWNTDCQEKCLQIYSPSHFK